MVCFSSVFALLFGKSNFKALGLTRVEVSIKNIKRRNTISVIDDILKFGFTLFLPFKFILNYCRLSKNSELALSIEKTILSILESRKL